MKGKQASMFMRVTQSDIVRTFALDIFSGLFICALLSPLVKKKRLKWVVHAKIVSMRGPAQDVTPAPALLCEGEVRIEVWGQDSEAGPVGFGSTVWQQCSQAATIRQPPMSAASRFSCFAATDLQSKSAAAPLALVLVLLVVLTLTIFVSRRPTHSCT